MHNPLAHFYRLAVPAARIAAGLAFGSSGARADGDGKPRGIGVGLAWGRSRSSARPPLTTWPSG